MLCLSTTDKYFTIRNLFCHTTPCISVHISFETTLTGVVSSSHYHYSNMSYERLCEGATITDFLIID